jgi:hypothetical protein
MSLITLLGRWWDSHGTRILGSLSSIVAGLILIPNLIPEAHQPYWAAANLVLGVITVGRGQSNANKKRKDARFAEIERERAP